MSDKNFKILKELCQKRFVKIGGNDIQKQRIVDELRFFKKHPSLLTDIVEFLKTNTTGGDKNEPNSFLFYLVGITNKEPDYEKEFTFVFDLDEENRRMSPPDIDIDFEQRDVILDYVCSLYGKEKVALIGTANAYKPKAAVQFAAKALDVTKTAKEGDRSFSQENDQEAKRLSKILPNLPGVTLSDYLGEKNSKGELFKPPNNRVKDAMAQIKSEEKKYPEVFDLAKKLEGLFKNFGTHAAGVVISSRDITDDVPLHVQRVTNEDGMSFSETGNSKLMTTQFDMEDIEDIGLLKFDFLQIDTLRQIRLCENLILKSRKIDKLPFDLNNLDTDDKNVLETINKCKLEGLFQISGEAFAGRDIPKKDFHTGKLLKDDHGNIKYSRQKGVMEIIGCTDFWDIAASNALGRPGPLICDMHRKYAENKKNKEKIKYSHPLLESILNETYGQLIYQEQLIEMSQKLAGFSYKLADKLRKACGKKKKELLDEVKPAFFKGCENNGVPSNVAEEMWVIANEFGGYAFNKAHSVAYAEITYQTAYLKTYYPEEFICAILTSMANKNDTDLQESIKNFKKEYPKLDILNPDINKSKETYIPTGKRMQILAPFISLPGIGEKVSNHLVSLQGFVDINHFMETIDKSIINTKCMETFIQNGVFNCLGDRQEIEFGIKANEQMNSMVKKNPKKKLFSNSGDITAGDLW